MALALAIAGAVVVGFLVLRAVNSALRSSLQRLLGSYYEYAAMLGLLAFSVVALLVFMYFVVPLIAWFGILVAVVVVLLGVLQMA